jgi:asparagine synthase (glutamine-hydrolysing)
MCGIFAYLGDSDPEKLIEMGNRIKHRGPDSTTYLVEKCFNTNLFIMFHRLAINGLDSISNQPFNFKDCILICNGEIYNYKELINKYNLKDEYLTNSDCEIIIHLYLKIGLVKTLKELNGHFAFMLYCKKTDNLFIARDPIGIRSLYWYIESDKLILASEIKSIVDLVDINDRDKIVQFPPGAYYSYRLHIVRDYYKLPDEYSEISQEISQEKEIEIINNIKELFIRAVNRQMLSSRKIACLVSGGLDSTTVCAILALQFPAYTLDTYSIGMKGSVDLYWAKKAAEYMRTNHTSIELTEDEFFDAIRETIYQIESYDTTTVRASVGNYLVSKYIKNNSDNTVIFCGDVSDEIFAGYRGFTDADSDENLFNENIKMLKNIHYFDVLRCEKSIAGAGLEGRVPFSDKEFVEYVMKINPHYKKFNKERMEKYLFRKAFEDYLPKELIWRRKEAFSDGVSSMERSWFEIIKERVDNIITDEEFNESVEEYSINRPSDKESLYYRLIFDEYFKGCDATIPYYWRHPFNEEKDPSARTLDSY